MTAQTAVQISDMDKYYGSFHALKNINLEIKRARKSWSVAHQGPVNPRSFVA